MRCGSDALKVTNILFDFRVTVSWKRGASANTANTAIIEIVVEDLGKDANICKTDEIGCSEVESKKKCLETCGVGTHGEG